MESRRRSILSAVSSVRNRRRDLLATVNSGAVDLGGIFEMAATDDVVTSTKVAAVLAALPGMGKVATKRLLARTGIDDKTKIGELRTAEKEALLDALS